MPPPDDLVDRVSEVLAALRLVRFTVSDSAIVAGETVSLQWHVDKGSEPDVAAPVSIRLNNSLVSFVGSRSVRPSRDIGFTLTAQGAGIIRTLGRVTIHVDQSACRQFEFGEDLLRSSVIAAVDNSIQEYNANPDNEDKISFRRKTEVEIEPSGILIRLRLKVEVNNFFDPDVDVDARIAVGVSPEGRALAWYKSFSTDVDWPWWVTGITIGVTKIIEQFKDGTVEDKIKPRMLNGFITQLQAQVAAFPGVVSAIETQQDRVLVTVCDAPIRIIGELPTNDGLVVVTR
jgi:hypothetical protein